MGLTGDDFVFEVLLHLRDRHFLQVGVEIFGSAPKRKGKLGQDQKDAQQFFHSAASL